jgi:phospholipid transport system substrate-binding protein
MASLASLLQRGWLALWLMLWSGAAAAAESPARATVEGFYQALLGTMKSASELEYPDRYQRIDPAVRAAFDLAQMTRFAVGPDWAKLAPSQQDQIVDTFSRLTVTNYASRFDGYSGERFEITGERPTQGNGVIVETQLIKSDGEAVVLNYLLRESAGRWLILDVHLSGSISELAVRRSEFNAVLKRDGFEGLVLALKRRIAELAAR